MEKLTPPQKSLFMLENKIPVPSLRQDVALTVIIDGTSSMQRWADAARKSVLNFLDEVLIQFPHDYQVSVIIYRDKKDVQPLQYLKFTRDFMKISEFIKKMEFIGGDDACEDMRLALKKASEQQWPSQNRSVIIVCDAPTHGKRYHQASRYEDDKSAYDEYPDDSEQTENCEYYIKKMVESRVKFIEFILYEQHVSNMYQVFNQCITDNNGKFLKLQMNDSNFLKDCKLSLQDLFNKKDQKSLYKAFIEKTQQIITFQKENIQIAAQFTEKPTNSIQTWEEMHLQTGFQATVFEADFTVLKLENLKFYNNKADFKLQSQKQNNNVRFQVSNTYVLKGSIREVYLMKNVDTDEKYFLKKPIGKQYNSKQEIFEDFQQYAIAQQLAENFNQDYFNKNKKNLPYRLSYLNLYLIEFQSKQKSPFNSQFMVCEKYLGNQFIKYNNNDGYVQQFKIREELITNENKTHAEEVVQKYCEINKIAQAYSHYTLECSLRQMLVVDLQGVETILTDPSIQSKQKYFGICDRGVEGYSCFLKTHTCNEYCSNFNLPKQENCEEEKLNVSQDYKQLKEFVSLDSLFKSLNMDDYQFPNLSSEKNVYIAIQVLSKLKTDNLSRKINQMFKLKSKDSIQIEFQFCKYNIKNDKEDIEKNIMEIVKAFQTNLIELILNDDQINENFSSSNTKPALDNIKYMQNIVYITGVQQKNKNISAMYLLFYVFQNGFKIMKILICLSNQQISYSHYEKQINHFKLFIKLTLHMIGHFEFEMNDAMEDARQLRSVCKTDSQFAEYQNKYRILQEKKVII